MRVWSLVQKIPWRRKWQPTPVFLLENPKDRGVWWATVHGVARSWTQLNTQHYIRVPVTLHSPGMFSLYKFSHPHRYVVFAILICISLMMNCAVCCFICLLALIVYLFWSIQTFCPFKKKWVLFFEFWRFLYILDINSSYVWFKKFLFTISFQQMHH